MSRTHRSKKSTPEGVRSSRRFSSLVSLMVSAALLMACSDYTIETTVNPDGSGLRMEHLEVQDHEDINVSAETFQAVMHTTRGDGWNHTETADDDGDPVHIFQRRTSVAGLSDWSNLNDKVQISGTVAAAANQTRGYVRLGEVRFYNQLHLSMAADSEGSTSFTYRETFRWDRAMDALVEFLMAELDAELANRFPDLREGERGQIIGFTRARFWVAVEKGFLTDEADENKLLGEIVLRTAEQGIKVVQARHPGAEQELLEEILAVTLIHNDDRMLRFLEEELPGINLGINSEITYRLNLPGRVTRSNAHEREGGTLVWEFSPGDALQGPIEIFAESEMSQPQQR